MTARDPALRVRRVDGVYVVSERAARALAKQAGTSLPWGFGSEVSVRLPRGARAVLSRREFDRASEFTPESIRKGYRRGRPRRFVGVWTVSPIESGPPALRWQRAPDGAPIWISLPSTDAFGRRFDPLYRIDARRRGGEPVRVDKGTIVGWEAIDGGGVASLKEARALAADHASRFARSRDPLRRRHRHRRHLSPRLR